MKELPFRSGESTDQDESQQDDGHRKEHRPAHEPCRLEHRLPYAPAIARIDAPLRDVAEGVFGDDYAGVDKGWYALAGGDVFKKLSMTDRFAIYPYVGFSVAAESFRFAGASPDRSAYLTRQFGVHAMFAMGGSGWLRFTVEADSFRRETFRAARVEYVRKL